MKDTEVEFIESVTLRESVRGLENVIVNVGSNFEPSIHPNFDEVISILTEKNKIYFISNCTNINDKLLDSISDNIKIEWIQISLDSTNKDIYENIRVGAKLEKTLINIKKIMKAKHIDTKVSVNMTLMQSNINDMINLVDFCESVGIDKINFIFMVVRNKDKELLDENLYSIKEDVFKRLDDVAKYVVKKELKVIVTSPYYFTNKELLSYKKYIKENAIYSGNSKNRDIINIKNLLQTENIPKKMSVLCSSPWTFARVLWNGEVDLCYKYRIGNIHENTLVEIFNSQRAKDVRKKIVTNPEDHCFKCDYYRFCLLSKEVDLYKKENYFTQELIREIENEK
jgi:radical SAM protein with 4Fe4S-binding SPASM domain